ncbi:STT3 domain-containing protein [Methanobacterium sp. ACI-7]|uniref:STT3 domain-containing protein n=1 Tax=unclassified Methanobacterium TaxID=2627676 RepID=UPI0039C35404
MNAKEVLFKLKPVIIILLLFSIVFLLRADAVNLSSIPDDYKSFYQDQNGLPYFSEMDSYYNLRLTQNYLENGYLGDTIINGTPWDQLSYYPEGRSAQYPPLIVYITAFVYKFLNLFTTIPLTAVAYWMAPFIASLCVIPAYLFISRLTNDYGGIAAALLVATAPAYFAHTFAGFFDTDMFNVLMPILVIWFFVESIRSDNFRNRTILVILSAVSMLLFAMAWTGWWYIFYIVIGIGVAYILASNYIFKMKTIRPFNDYPDKVTWFKDQKSLFTLLIFIIISSILIMLYSGFSGFFGTLVSAFGFTNIQSAIQGTAYPNVLVSVSELQIPSLADVATNTGLGAFILGILCIPLLIWKFKPDLIKTESATTEKAPKRKTKPRRKPKNVKSKVVEEKVKTTKKTIDPKLTKKKMKYLFYVVLFGVWILFTAYTVTKGSRFIEGFSIPMGLAAGLFIGLIVPIISKYLNNAKYCAVVMLIIVAVVSYPSVAGAYTISNSVVPGTDDSMYDSLAYIKNNTSSNTVITSWWDFGHLFAAAADRPVTFDGGSQDSPRAYWVGKALLTSNEDLSAGILRMLSTGGDKGYRTLENYTKNTGKSVEILDKILPVDKQNAQTILINEYKLTPDQAQNVLQYTHPDNPNPHVFITSSDMLGKASWWSYFGSWNFQNNTGQHYVYSAAQGSSQKVNGTTAIAAQNGVVAQINGSEVVAGLRYDQGNGNQVIAPHKLTVIINNQVVKNEIVSNESPISIFLVIEEDSSLAIVMNKELEDSMFTRLFLFRGAGLNKFKIASEKPGVTVWNVT